MYRLIYTSRSLSDLSSEEISVILSQARRRNAEDGITGLLLYHNRLILQVLEGEEVRVKTCYDRISRDGRHTDVQLRQSGPAQSAFFSDWFMGYETLEALPALGRIAGGKALITLEQLEERLSVAENVHTSDRKKMVIAALQQYLSAATGQGAIAAE